MWEVSKSGEHEFTGGKTAWETVSNLAKSCNLFKEDVEEEWVADSTISCYNCRFRKWTIESFICTKRS